MRQSAVRWIAVALVGALIGVAVIAVAGGTAGGGDATEDGDGEAVDGTAASAEPVDGPHVVIELCAGVACDEVDEDDQQALVAELQSDPRVTSARFVSSEQAYQLFLDRHGDQEDLVESVRPEDVPASIELELVDPEQAAEVAAEWEARPEVATARDARSLTP